jgi:hypothetical protein
MKGFVFVEAEELAKVYGMGGDSGGGDSGSGYSGSGDSGSSSTPEHQTPYDPNDYHCDIIAYNLAVDNGHQAGSWDGNTQTVNQIFSGNYASEAETAPEAGSCGYVFYDWNNDGTFDHMEYYESNSYGSYTVYETDGINENTQAVTYYSASDTNGKTQTGSAAFVALN